MVRPIWKGHISFGLVNVAITLYPAERRYDLSFKLIDSRNHARVRYERVNEETGEEVPWDQIVHGYEFDDGNYVLMSDEDFKRVAIESSRTIEIENFVPRDAIADLYFDKPYYLVPGRKSEKGYVLLREALERTRQVGIARVVIRKRQYLTVLQPVREALVLNLLRFQDELRRPEEFDLPRGSLEDYQIRPREIDMAVQLIESMSSDWDASAYHDDYREALLAWIEEKARTGKDKTTAPGKTERDEPEAEIVDMMDLLKRSVAEHGGGKSGSGTRKKATKTAKPTRKKAAARKRGAG